ncbi:MAG: polyphosphate kinase 1 [candidate division Zixibacteria bacterium]|nr:polyphosphate kinase 1 [candidate division Zixibacteria bacterium]
MAQQPRVDDVGNGGSAVDLNDPSLYINRELSFLEFNKRVLHLSKDPNTPLLEKLRFLTICSTNLDEFFEIRVAGRKEQVALGLGQDDQDGLTSQQLLERISVVAHEMVTEQYRVLQEEILPALADEGIRILKRDEWTESQREWVYGFFHGEVFPVVTPKGLDPAHPFPRILNKSLNFIVSLKGTDAFGRHSRFAVVQVPRSLPRVIKLPTEISGNQYDFVLLSAVIHDRVEELFPGMTVTGCYQFRATRNSDLWVDEEEVDDLLHALKGELRSRNYAAAVRLEVAENCSEEMTQFLLRQFHLEQDDLYQVNGPVNMHRMVAIHDMVDRPELKYPTFIPGMPANMNKDSNIFERIRNSDMLLHHPYQSFTPVLELVRQAARDPNVLAIKQTLYRTGSDSSTVDALIDAARTGKEVTAIVELRARFDEAANIDLATRLQEAGANVVYGVVGYKTHGKMVLVVRREHERLRFYVHLGTGNYHAKTTLAYTDFSLLTCDEELGQDTHKLFMQLTGLGRFGDVHKILHAPFTLENGLLQLIRAETKRARDGQSAAIMAKMNSLSEPRVIRALYEASQAGVSIDLVVRGICCLRPGIPGVSENIRVRSILGRFLEHSRAFYFHAGGKGVTYCASADWMPRNLYRRMESCFPIDDPELRERVYEEALTIPLEDNCQAWTLDREGQYHRGAPRDGEERRPTQERLLERYTIQRTLSSKPTA